MAACGVTIHPYDIAFGIDSVRPGRISAGDVNAGERALAQHKAVFAWKYVPTMSPWALIPPNASRTKRRVTCAGVADR
jgi:hypothetical protein